MSRPHWYSGARGLVALLSVVATLFIVSKVWADPVQVTYVRSSNPQRAPEIRVAPQPFSFDPPAPRTVRAIKVAYSAPPASAAVRGEWVEDESREAGYASEIQPVRYTPRPAPRALPVQEDTEQAWAMPDFNADARPMVRGNRAMLRNGIAYAPSNAPDSVKAAIWAVNALRGKPYKWGGGHGSLHDWGYDCSGAVSFALYHAGVLGQPLPSGDFLRYGQRGRGRWITIYSRRGHTFAVIAGLRLDTTDFRGGDVGPRWHTDPRDTWGFAARHPAGL